MILDPHALALLLSSVLVDFLVLYATVLGIRILRYWDLRSGSELQLLLERRTYLVSILLAYAMAFQLASLFLFIHAADAFAPFFVGAMCAAGTLNATSYGYPSLLLKIGNFLLAGAWLLLNRADNMAPDYPLIREKYGLLLPMAPLLLAESAAVYLHFSGMEPGVITSCCGSLFGASAKGVASEVASLPPGPSMAAFYACLAASICWGGYFLRTGRGAFPFAAASAATAAVSAVALVSVLCLYVYELPSHHCPFCLLQGEYGYVGYPLYLSLLGGCISGAGVGILAPFRKIPSLASAVPGFQDVLARCAMLCYALFGAIASYPVVFSDFRMFSG
jgi:hypothetical protein